MEYGKKYQDKEVIEEITQTTTSLSIDLNKTRLFIITLESDLDTITVSNIQKGEQYKFVFIQDVVGGREVIFPAALDFDGTIDQTAESVTAMSGIAYSNAAIKGTTGASSGGAAGLFEPVQSITDVQAFNTTDAEIWVDKYAILIEDEEQFYRYDRQSAVSEALPYIIAPGTGPGRFIQDQYTQLQSKSDKVGGDNQIDYTPTSPPAWLSAILTGGKALLRAALDKIIATMVEKTDFVALTDASNTLLNCQNSYEAKLTWEVPLLATTRTLTLSNVLAGSVGVIKILKVDAANLSITFAGTGLTHAGSVDIDNKVVLVGDENSEYLISFIRIASQINWSEIYRTK